MTDTTSYPLLWAILALLVCLSSCQTAKKYDVTLDLENSNYTTDLKFVSFAVSARTLLRTDGTRARFKISSPRMIAIAKAVRPCSVRVGGTAANFLIYNSGGEEGQVPANVMKEWSENFGADFWGGKVRHSFNIKFTGDQWLRWMNFAKNVGWDVIYDVNQFLQNGSVWDPTNFKALLEFSKEKGVAIAGFELGNEPNSYEFRYNWDKSTADMVFDFKRFTRVLAEFPEYKDSLVVGPDPTSLVRNRDAPYFLADFLKDGGDKYIDVIGLHHYYFSPRSPLQIFSDPTVFDMFKTLAQRATAIRDQYAAGKPIFMTETAHAYGGGSRKYSWTFASTFIYMDEMGLAAKYGIERTHRQTFNSGDYALVDYKNLEPYPDYYVALLMKNLVEGPVINIDITPQDSYLRLYAHCARRDIYSFQRGSVVVYYANLHDTPVTLDLTKQYSGTISTFILTPGEEGNLASPTMKLNGKIVLQMDGDNLPKMPADEVKGPVTLPGQSLGFLVMQHVTDSVCWKYTPTEPRPS